MFRAMDTRVHHHLTLDEYSRSGIVSLLVHPNCRLFVAITLPDATGAHGGYSTTAFNGADTWLLIDANDVEVATIYPNRSRPARSHHQ